ncbi:Hydroxypyruvate isomerase [bacterium HR36]|nr:Hydroxypyruvate isomerase [bacterium HR36]
MGRNKSMTSRALAGRMTRRLWLASVALSGSAATAWQLPAKSPGRIRQSIVFWCFNIAGEKWDVEKTCQVARQLGCVSVELVEPHHWPVLKKYGLICAIAPNGMPGAPFVRGFNNPRYHEEVITRTRQAIDACAEAGFPNVIAFVGYKWRDAEDPKSGEIPRDEAERHCLVGLKKIVPYAEKKGVTLCLEHLNTRDTSHPMKGHPGYQGDDLDWLAGIIRKIGSPRLKLLFDIYHVQIMHGDIIRRLEENKDILGHIHTAGVPGRGELDEHQELNYPAIMRKLLQIGYQGYVGQEFIPTRDPLAGLKQAVALCDV